MNTQVVEEILNTEGDAIVTAFAEALAKGGASVADWSARYPEFGRDFARIAAQSFTFGTTFEPDAFFAESDRDAAATERLRNVAQNTLLRYKAAYLGTQSLVSLVDKESGVTAAKLAEATLLPLPFVAKLNQRLFTAASVPAQVVARIAETIGRSVDEVNAFLAGPPMLSRAAAYRADDAPMVGEQEDFHAALQADASVPENIKALYSTL